MTATITDLFCGAGGSSLGATAAGAQLVMAANHWQTAIDVHQAHFPEARHDLADISQADPRRYPVTDILIASPECDRIALVDAEQVVDDCGFRMLEPHEIAAAMAFPKGYIPATLPKKDRVKLAGNAVTPPVMAWIVGRLLQAMEAAS